MEALELDDIQGLVAYSYVGRPHALYALLRVEKEHAARARASLRRMLPRVGTACSRGRQATADVNAPVIALAFTHDGLDALGLDRTTLATFVPEFRQGMAHPHRARVLGDHGVNEPESWDWGNYRAPHFGLGQEAEAPARKANPPVHVVVAAFGRDPAALEQWLDGELRWAEGALVREYKLAAQLMAEPDEDAQPVEPGDAQPDAAEEDPQPAAAAPTRPTRFRENFGFRDGISQPYVAELGRPAPAGDASSNRVKAGEFVLGYRNQLGHLSASPFVAPDAGAGDRLPRMPDGRWDLGRNGSFLVVRELQQHVEEFRKLAPNVQAKLMGRWPSGAPLTLSPDRDRPELRDRNDFDYFARDRAGLQCPVGAHVRRANPRDAFADPALQLSAADAIASVNHHRILRRGRPYVRPEKTGMFFMCLNTNIDRQFEFVQQNWLANRGFGRLRGEQDFAVGNETSFTIPHCAGRQKLQLSAFVRVRGGGYFFLPGIRALRYLTRD